MVFLRSSVQGVVMTKTLAHIFIDILAQPRLTRNVLIFNAALICCGNCIIDHH